MSEEPVIPVTGIAWEMPLFATAVSSIFLGIMPIWVDVPCADRLDSLDYLLWMASARLHLKPLLSQKPLVVSET